MKSENGLSKLEQKKIQGVVSETHKLIESIQELMNSIELAKNMLPSAAVFILGSTIMTPKEVYVINFNLDHFRSAFQGHSSPISDNQAIESAKKLLRTLIDSLSNPSASPAEIGTSKLYVLIKGKRDQEYASCTPKQNFELKNKASRPKSVFFTEITLIPPESQSENRMQINDENINNNNIPIEAAMINDGDDFIWYQFIQTITGLPQQ